MTEQSIYEQLPHRIKEILKPSTPEPDRSSPSSETKEDSPEFLLKIQYTLDDQGQPNIKHYHIGMPHKDDVEMSNCFLCRHILRHFDKFTNGIKSRLLALGNSLKRS